MRHSLERDGEPQLAFFGTQLASVSSASTAKRRWTELALYQTDSGRFVVQTIACSSVKGEANWFSARAFDTIDDAIKGLRDKKRGTLSRLALELLEVAAEESDVVTSALDAIEQTEEVIS